MPLFKPLKGYRPKASEAKRFASLPFDTVSCRDVTSEFESQFLKVTRPDLFTEMYPYDDYSGAKAAICKLIETGEYRQDPEESFYLYGLTSDSKSYYGLIGCLSVEDYKSGVLKRHELTRPEKVHDRLRHILNSGFHTEPVFASIRYNLDVDLIINDCLFLDPEYDFVTSDGVTHQFWKITNTSKLKRLQDVFSNEIESVYIADGHHRCAASVAAFDSLSSAGKKSDESGVFLAAVFPMHQLQCKSYHRILSMEKVEVATLLNQLSVQFDIQSSDAPFFPSNHDQIGLFVDSLWYQLKYKLHHNASDSATAFNEFVVSRVFGINNVQDSEQIDYIGKKVDVEGLLADPSGLIGKAFFTLPTLSVQQIFDLSDAGVMLPPKSTWFDPKPRSGLVIHSLEI